MWQLPEDLYDQPEDDDCRYDDAPAPLQAAFDQLTLAGLSPAFMRVEVELEALLAA